MTIPSTSRPTSSLTRSTTAFTWPASRSQAPDVVIDLPLNVTLVLDGSGSMADGNRVDIAREAAETIRSSLGRDDRMSIVHFDNNVKRGVDRQRRRPPEARRSVTLFATSTQVVVPTSKPG